MIDGRVSPAQIYAADGASAGQLTPASSAPMEETASTGAAEYSVDFGEGDQRSMTLSAIVDAYNTGSVTADTYVWADGMADWTPLGEVSEIVESLHAAASSAGGSESAPGGASPWGQGANPSVVERAAVAATAPVAKTDLFGGYASAGSEEDVTTSLPQDTPAPTAAQTGARNESSVLFSLSALTASAGSSPPAALVQPTAPTGIASLGMHGSSRDAGEDSGLIDLAALTAQTGGQPLGSEDSGMFGAPLGIAAPLGAPIPSPALAGPAFDTGPLEYPKNNNKTAFIIGGAIVLAAVVVGGMFAFKSEPEAVVQPAPIITTPAPAPTPEPEPTAAATSTAAPPTTGVADDGAPDAGKAATPKKPPRGGGWKPRTNTTKPPTGGAAKPEVPKPPAPAKSKCSCPPGDLKCAMRCAAKG